MRRIWALATVFCVILAGCNGGSKNNSSSSITPTPTLTSIGVSPATANVAINATQQLTATGTYSDSTTKDVTSTASWSSSTATVATISASGLATAVAAGKSTITATLSQVSGTATVTVPPILKSIAITPASPSGNVGATTQLAATGTYSDATTQDLTSSATWSSSNSAIATVSTAGLLTFVAAGTATITATSGSVSGTDSVTVQAPSISAVSNSNPLPLTPLSISTTGLNTTSPLTVNFADTAGFSVSIVPTRVQSDGTVVVAVPLYVDTTTGAPQGGVVAMSITQGSITTSPTTVTIQNLPTVASYGVAPGAITHAVLIFQSLILSQRINALEALGGATGSQIDTTASVTSLKAQLAATIGARSDVDRVSVDSGVVVPAATTTTGTQIQFDATTLDLMDRVQAIFLMQTFGSVVLQVQANPPSGPVVSAVKGAKLRIHATPRQKVASSSRSRVHILVNPWAYPRATPSPTTKLGQILIAIQGVNTAFQIPLQTVKALNPTTTAAAGAGDPNAILDQVSAIGAGIDAVAKWLPPNATFGYVTALLSTTNTVVHCITNDASYIYAEATGDTATAAIIAQDMASNYTKDIDALVTITSAIPAFEGVAALSSVYSYWTTGRDYYCLANGNTSSVCPDQADESTGQQVAAQDSTVFNSSNPGLVDVTGTVDLTSNLGLQAPDGGIELSPETSGGSTVDTMADPSGAYQMYIPLGNSNYDYAAAPIALYDPLTGTVLDSLTVNLATGGSTVHQGSPLIIPTLSGTCEDDDIDDPDGDDPDCD
jgi:hypothetical protein